MKHREDFSTHDMESLKAEHLFYRLKSVYSRLDVVPRFYIIPAGLQIFSS
jgi:hypothetical protein